MFASTPRWIYRIKGKTCKATPSQRRWVKPRLEGLEDRTLLSVQILFDYSHDTNGFFTQHPEAKAILQEAAGDLTSRLSTSTPLLAIASSGSNSWTAKPFDPAYPAQTLSIPNLSVPKDSLVVFVGGSNLPTGGELGLGGPGGFVDSGDPAFLATVQSRGQTGFAPWGGSISFDISPGDNWYFGTSPSVPQGQADFFSVATHELGHILGIGTSSQWRSLVQSGSFIGSHAEAAYNHKPVPLDQSEPQDRNGHWANGVMSNVPDGSAQQAAMDPSIPSGARDYFTALDYAGLQDLGWQVLAGNPSNPPTITGNPRNQTVAAGQSATFFASASGSPAPAVQWQLSTDGGKTFRNISGAANTTLTLNHVTPLMNGYQYEAVFTNSAGSKTTSAATLAVKAISPPPSPSAVPPTLNVPPLLSFFDSLLGGITTLNADGTETVTDNFLGIPLLVSTYDHSGKLMSVDLFGFIDITFLFG